MDISQDESLIPLQTANGGRIKTYGEETIKVSLGLKKYFEFTFLVADVKCPIIGADFLCKYNLLIDIKGSRIIDGNKCIYSIDNSHIAPQVSLITDSTSPYFNLISEYSDLTLPSNGAFKNLPDSYHHTILTTGPPVASRPRRLSPKLLSEVKIIISKLLKEGKIRHSTSPYGSPINLVKKGGSSYRVTGDYRKLNAITTPDKYPLNFLSDFTTELSGKTLFSKIDLKDAFFQIPMEESSINKTAIVTPIGSFEWLVMPQGLRNSAQSFQRYINKAMHGLDFTFAYVDDVLVASSSEQEHIQHLNKVFQRLREFKLQINPAKCLFGVTSLDFLGYNVNSTGILPAEDKVKAVREFSRPTTLRELQQFLGLINFNRKFLCNAATTLKPLTILLKNAHKRSPNSKVNWSNEAEEAFVKIKDDLATATLLVHPRKDCMMKLTTDASGVGVGAVLEQFFEGNWETLGYFSRSLNKSELNYSTFSKELLAIALAIRHFNYILLGSEFFIETDCKAIIGAFNSVNSRHSPREARALEYISQFTNDIRHVSGNQNKSDILSRKPIDNTHSTHSLPSTLNNFTDLPVMLTSFPKIDYRELSKDQSSDEELIALKSDPNFPLKWHEIKLPGSNLYLTCDLSTGYVRPYLPEKYRKLAFDQIHNIGHPGTRATIKLMTSRFIWKDMRKNIRDFNRNCQACQKAKVNRHTKPPPVSFKAPDERFQTIHVDIVGPFPRSKEGYKYLLTVICRFNKWVEAYPLKDITAKTVADTFFMEYVPRFGVPSQIISDRGLQFQSNIFSQLTKLTASEHILTSAYHPTGNSIIERMHRTLKASLLACGLPARWLQNLPLTLLALRNTPKVDSDFSPAQMTYGNSLRLPGDIFVTRTTPISINEYTNELIDHMTKNDPLMSRRTNNATDTFMPQALDNCTHVFVRDKQIRPSFSHPYRGPYKILKRGKRSVILQGERGKLTYNLCDVKPVYDSSHVQNSLIMHKPKKSVKIDLNLNTTKIFFK